MESAVICLSICNCILVIALTGLCAGYIPLFYKIQRLELTLKSLETDVKTLDEVVDNILSASGVGKSQNER